MDDLDQSLSDISGSAEHLRQEMVRLSKHSFRRSRTRGWVARMRCLIINQLECATASSSQPENDSSGNQYLSSSSTQVSASEKNTLQLAPRSTLKDASEYAAVSYCWDRAHSTWTPNDNVNPPLVICEDLSRRPSNAPSDVLYRSMTFAKAKNINAIWIDQECIDQSDPVDKKNAIQEMDKIYEESQYPVAVLDFNFQTQIELDVFVSICDYALYTFDLKQIEVLESVLIALSDDKWFERAWTLQESVSAGGRMTLLFGCTGLQKPPCFGSTTGEFEISVFNFQNAMVNVRLSIEKGLIASVWPDSSIAVIASNCADYLLNFIPSRFGESTNSTWQRDASYRRIPNAAQALVFLEDRLNSCFSDRLAILANLCDYEYRIDTEVLEHPSTSFSICLLTLAILNGDMSLLAGYVDEEDWFGHVYLHSMEWGGDHRSYGIVYRNDDNDVPSNTYGFSWGPRPLACLQNITYLEEYGAMFRLKPASLSMYGLRVCGVVWEVNFAINVPKTQQKLVSRWQQEIVLQNGERPFDGLERQKPLVQDFFWSLIHELIESGFIELSKNIWNYVQPWGRSKLSEKSTEESDDDSIGAPLPYSYDMIFGHLVQSSTANKSLHYDEQEVRGRIRTFTLSFDTKNPVVDRPEVVRLLIEQVCKDGALVCAAPFSDSPRKKRPHVWFEACKIGDQIFTPVTDVADGAAHSWLRGEALSWRVLATGRSVDGCPILHCLGRRRGVWRVEDVAHRDYILE